MDVQYVTREMVLAAEAFQSACIEAGYQHARVRYDSRGWNGGSEGERLRIFGFDARGTSQLWEQVMPR